MMRRPNLPHPARVTFQCPPVFVTETRALPIRHRRARQWGPVMFVLALAGLACVCALMVIAMTAVKS